ncbi:RDD family protein [Agaribacterium haliotis]|uniref:RDD family protein n=1 Tax=Agaribacterium haliotis TaxID=2013869 RepID=UPI000BB54855|nr:RDD family protein [Agaribacterium haliotis]
MFDISYSHETPEGVDLEVELAGPFVRCLAFALDFLLRAFIVCLMLVVALIIGYGNQFGWGLFLLFLFLIEWFYPLLFEFFRGGQTPGKKAMGIYVINDDLSPLSFSATLTRNLLRAADFLPLAYGFAFLSIVVSGRFQRLGDLAAGTLVVHKHQQQLESLPANTEALAPPAQLNSDEQLSLIEFYLRQQQLSPQRQQELAQLIAPALNLSHSDAVRELHLMGAWLLGARGQQ